MQAITIGEDAAFVHEEKCIGCGLCVSTCPSGAMGLIERTHIPSIPATTQDMAVKVLQEKGRLEAFMKVMQS
jgi:Fe-S-cluster-containing hydrogenase component 2